MKLNEKLNKTYIAYGRRGEAGKTMQAAQDVNASSVSVPTQATRVAAKASIVYNNSRWDLVDAVKDRKVKLEDVKKEDLPKEMQAMSVEERKKYTSPSKRKNARNFRGRFRR